MKYCGCTPYVTDVPVRRWSIHLTCPAEDSAAVYSQIRREYSVELDGSQGNGGNGSQGTWKHPWSPESLISREINKDLSVILQIKHEDFSIANQRTQYTVHISTTTDLTYLTLQNFLSICRLCRRGRSSQDGRVCACPDLRYHL